MAWVAVGAAAVGAVGSAYAGRQAANAHGRASEANIAEQRRQFDQLQANQQPYMGYGQGSGGIGGLQALANGDYSGFMNSPDYLASQKAGLYALDHSASARDWRETFGRTIKIDARPLLMLWPFGPVALVSADGTSSNIIVSGTAGYC